MWRKEDILTDNILGTDGDDVLRGTHRSETFTGGRGRDRLEGGGGDDTYVWNLGDGNDVIEDSVGSNTLKLGSGIEPDKVRAVRYGQDIAFEISGTGERITVEGWYRGRANQLNRVQFADGTVWSKDDIGRMTAGIYGTDGEDHLVGTEGDDRFFGFHGDDVLEGGKGDDVYEWNAGDGNDTIRDAAGLSRVKFGADVVPGDIWVVQDAVGKFLYDHRTKERIRPRCFEPRK